MTEKLPKAEISVHDEIRDIPGVENLPAAARRNRSRKPGSRRERQSIDRVRGALADMLERNADQYDAWFKAAAVEHPLKALILMKDIAEYFMPKLGRMEQVGEVTHKVQHFVPMIAREERPSTVIDAEFTPVPKIENKP